MSIKFGDVKIQNFLAIESAQVNLSDKGLVLVSGINKTDSSATSNGSGKSSLADALCWGLYGKTARDESGDAIVSRHRKRGEGCHVQTQVFDGNQEYLISRYRKDSNLKNKLVVELVNGSSHQDLTKGTDTETQELVNKLLGCDHKIFVAAIYSGQESAPDLPMMTPKFLTEIVEEGMGVSVTDRAHDLAKMSVNKLNTDISTLQGEIGNKYALHKAKLDQVQLAIDANTRFSTQLVDRQIDQQSRMHFAKTEWEKHKQAREAIEQSGFSPQTAQDELTQLQNQPAVGKSDETVELEGQVRKLVSAGLQLSAKREQIKNQAATAMKEKADASNAVGSNCKECGSPLNNESFKKIITAKNDELGKLHSQIPELNDKEKRLSDLKISYEAALQKSIDKDNAAAGVARDRIMALNHEIGKHALALQTEQSAKSAYDTEKARLTALDHEKPPHDAADIAKLKDEADTLLAECETSDKAVDAKKELLKAAEACADTFSPSGLRAHLIDTVVPYLNAQTAKYIHMLSDGFITVEWTTRKTTKAGAQRDAFHIKADKATGGSSFKLLSGGEKRKVRLACFMALQDVVKNRADKNIDLFIADEIDDAVDEAGLERLMNSLQDKAASGSTVLVISHNELGDWIDDETVVTNANGKATVSGALVV